MLNILIPVDGSANAARATETFLATIGNYKETPRIDLLAVHLPIPHVPRLGLVVTHEAVQSYYDEECDAMLAPSKKLLDAAGVKYHVQRAVGPIAETIVDQAGRLGSSMIWMGTRGMTAVSNMLLGSIATKVLHLAKIPVVLTH
jgi:nucleotide-binding universal stress UspA family protein